MNQHTPFPPLLSATVIIGRDKPSGYEIFMVVRHRKTDFASGALVFPGGKVEEGDRIEAIRDFCDGADGQSNTMISVMTAAIRETFEESGILLARSRVDGEMLTPDRLISLGGYRDLLVDGKISLIEFLKKEKLTLACDQLTRFAHWITPELMPKRFDTHFFLARIPQGQGGTHDGTETVDSIWLSPKEILEETRAGRFSMMFPTIMNLMKLEESATLDEAMDKASSTDIVTVMPWPEERETGPVLCIPENAGYPVTEESIENILEAKKG